MKELRQRLGRRFARLTTDVVTRHPRLWRVFRGSTRRQFNRMADRWDAMRSADAVAPVEAGLERLKPPGRVLDLGTGTGRGAFAIARRIPRAEVVGLDVSDRMIDEARKNVPAELAGRVRFEVGDAARLPYDDASFDLVVHANMFPFVDELDRVLAPGGHALFSFSSGPETPIYVSPERLREQLGRRGFAEFAEFAAGSGTGFLARKPGRS
ncbi:MAG: class I SAM-dependent methyltransferase [Actinomycetota bacterium]|nr:class I SAM-dependent methyltransferase [Actinomycetota bacterium]